MHKPIAVASEPVSFVVAARQNPALTIQASRARVTSGQSLTVSGVVTGAHAAPVTLLARSGGESFQEVAHTATDGTGAFAFTQAPLANTTYLVRSDHIRSRALFQPVSFALSASASATSIAPGEAVTFSGSVGPPTGGQTVYLQRPDASGLGWHVVDTATVAPDGRYAITHVLAGAQSTVLRVRVPPANGIQAASSQAFTIEVSQPPAA